MLKLFRARSLEMALEAVTAETFAPYRESLLADMSQHLVEHPSFVIPCLQALQIESDLGVQRGVTLALLEATDQYAEKETALWQRVDHASHF